MAQLSDDCFAFGGPMMSVDEAVRLITARVTAVREIQTVGLAEADGRILAPSIQPERPPQVDAGYARRIRSQTRLTQAEFAARIGVPIETVRNWEQGKRHPRGPARALLKLLDEAPDVAFSVLGRKSA